MITTDVILVAVELTLIVAFALVVSRTDIESSSQGLFGGFLAAPRLPARPQGVQEEDLPRFVFRAPAPSLNPA